MPDNISIDGTIDTLVVRNSEIQILSAAVQGPPGPPGTSEKFTAENKELTDTIAAGQVAATHFSGTGVVRASAADASKPGIGLALRDIAAAHADEFLLGGVLELADWTEVIGAATLAAKTIYYLSDTPGMLTATPPSATGHVVQQIGISLSPTQLDIQIEPQILL